MTDDRKTHTTYPKVYAVTTGDLTTGFVFYGTFESRELANIWASGNLKTGASYEVHIMEDVRAGDGSVELKIRIRALESEIENLQDEMRVQGERAEMD